MIAHIDTWALVESASKLVRSELTPFECPLVFGLADQGIPAEVLARVIVARRGGDND